VGLFGKTGRTSKTGRSDETDDRPGGSNPQSEASDSRPGAGAITSGGAETGRRADPKPSSAPAAGRNTGEKMANIGKSISISGDLTGEEDLIIEGKVEGKVSLPNSQLTVGANGSVKAEVSAKSVIVIGRVAGNVRGAERVEIQATGVVDGDVSAPKLVVVEGAVLNGAIQMTGKSGATAAAATPEGGAGGVRKVG